MNNSKRFLALLAVATVATPAFTVSAADFKDVSSTYQLAVDFLIDAEIAQGVSATEFGTTQKITRGDAAVMIANALYIDTSKAPASPFTDTNSRIKKSVDALYTAGIINGKTKTTFDPSANITRAEMAKILTNAFKLTPSTIPTSFEDVNSTWEPFVAALLEAEVTSGKTLTSFAPYDAVTRGEFALFLYRGKEYLPTKPVPGVDVTAPVFDYDGLKNFTIAYGATYTPPVITATDNTDGKVEVQYQIFFGNETTAIKEVDTLKSGTYTIRYSARDKAGNATILELKVVVQPAITSPSIPIVTPDQLSGGTVGSPVVINQSIQVPVTTSTTTLQNVVVNGNLTLSGSAPVGGLTFTNVEVTGNLDLSQVSGTVDLEGVTVTGEIIF